MAYNITFVAELARMYATGSAMEPIALMTTIVLPKDQRPRSNFLERHLKLWMDGSL